MRILFILMLPLLSSSLSFSQPINNLIIQGEIADSTTGQSLSYATVSLQLVKDSSRISTRLTNKQGLFSFHFVQAGHYFLTISYIGYKSLTKPIIIKPANKLTILGILKLSPSSILLREVIVQRQMPIRIKNDTLEFNSTFFSTQPNANAENLLSKLPGVSINTDGTVTAQGQTVQQVFVNGKPFFGSDTKMAMRNLPASIIAKIQIYDKRSDQATFSGIDDGRRIKSINIVTHNEGRQGWFGQQVVGYGSDARYQVGIGLNYFRPSVQISLLGQSNNLNLFGTSLPSFSSLSSPVLSDFTQSSGITRTLGNGVNYSSNLNKRLEVSSSYLFTKNRTEIDQTTRRQTIGYTPTLPADTANFKPTIISENHSLLVSQVYQHSFNLGVNYHIDSLNDVRIAPSISVISSTNDARSTTRTLSAFYKELNQSLSSNTVIGTSINAANSIQWQHRFRRRDYTKKPGFDVKRTLSVMVNTSLNQSITNGANKSENQFFTEVLTGHDTVNYSQFNQHNAQSSRSLTNELSVRYTEPLRVGGVVEIRYIGSVNKSNTSRRIIDINEQTGLYDQPNLALSSQYQSLYLTNRLGATWQARRSKYVYTVGFDVQQAIQINNNLIGYGFKRNFLNLLPVVLLQPQLGKDRYLQINYQSQVNAPTVLQLLPVPDITNPLQIRVGNPNLRPEYTHQLSVTYNHFNSTTYKSIFALLSFALTKHRIVTATTIDTVGVQIIQPINANGGVMANSTMTLSQPIHYHLAKANLNFTTSINLNRSISYINDQPNHSMAVNASQIVSLNGTINQTVDIGLSYAINYQRAAYSLHSQFNGQFVSNTLTTQLTYKLPFNLLLSTNISYKANEGGTMGFNQRFIMWNAYIRKLCLSRQQGEFRFQVFDLLNQNRSISRSITSTYVEDIQSRVLQRYIILSFIYNLQQFNARKE